MRKGWYVIYTDWGYIKRKFFGNNAEEAKKFAESEENGKVYYGFC